MQQKLLPQPFFLSRNMSVDGTYFKMMHQISLVNLVTLTAIVHPAKRVKESPETLLQEKIVLLFKNLNVSNKRV